MMMNETINEDTSSDDTTDSYYDEPQGTTNDSLFTNKDDQENSKPSDARESVRMERPDYWPSELWDEDKGIPKMDEAHQRMEKAEKKAYELRKALSNKKSFEEYKKAEGEELESNDIPESYDFSNLPEDIANTLDENELNIFQDAAKDSGLNNEQANKIVEGYLSRMLEQVEERREAEKAKLGPNFNEYLESLNGFAQSKLHSKYFSEEEVGVFQNMINSADSARVIGKIIELTGEKPIPISVHSSSEIGSLEDIRKELVHALRESRYKDSPEVIAAREKLKRFQ